MRFAFTLACLFLAQNVQAEDCGSVSENGQCEGNVLKQCKDGQLEVIDCAQKGVLCSTYHYQEKAYAVCVTPNNPYIPDFYTDCGPVSNGGFCDGNTVVYCNPAAAGLEINNCIDDHYAGCHMADVDGETGAYCYAADYVDCGDVTSFGTCEGNLLKGCHPSYGLVTKDCAEDGNVCAPVPGYEEYSDCLPPSLVDGGSEDGGSGPEDGSVEDASDAGEDASETDSGSEDGGSGPEDGSEEDASDAGGDASETDSGSEDGGSGSEDAATADASDAGRDASKQDAEIKDDAAVDEESDSDDGCSSAPLGKTGLWGWIAVLSAGFLRRRNSKAEA